MRGNFDLGFSFGKIEYSAAARMFGGYTLLNLTANDNFTKRNGFDTTLLLGFTLRLYITTFLDGFTYLKGLYSQKKIFLVSEMLKLKAGGTELRVPSLVLNNRFSSCVSVM